MTKFLYLIIGSLVVFYSCSGNSADKIESENYLGEYKVETLYVYENGKIVDKIKAGFNLELTLKANGQFTGIVVFGDGDLSEQKLSGTYVTKDKDIKFITDQDTFLRDLEWKIEDSSIFSTSNSIQCILKKI